MKTKITHRTIIGYAVNTSPTQDNPGYHFETPTAPEWTGTVKTLGEALENDRYLNSLTNTYYSSAYFVKVKGTWLRVVDRQEFAWAQDELYDPWDGSHAKDEIEVEVDYPTEASRAAAQLGRKPKGDTSRKNGRLGGRPRKN